MMDGERIKDAKYYLLHPKNSSWVYLMADKPDYIHEPFYIKAKTYLDAEETVEDYLRDNSCYYFDLEDCTSELYDCLEKMDMTPYADNITYFFGEPETLTQDAIVKILDKFSLTTDSIVAKYYKLHNWHIKNLLEESPFKEYIQEHYFPKSEGIAIPSETSEKVFHHRGPTHKNEVNRLNKRLLI